MCCNEEKLYSAPARNQLLVVAYPAGSNLSPVGPDCRRWFQAWKKRVRRCRYRGKLFVYDIFMLAAALRYLISRHNFFLWGTGLLGLIMCREIHFEGTDPGMYIGLLMLLGIALLKYDKFKDYLDNPLVINLLLIGFFTYFLSQTLDQRWWKGLPGERIVHVSLEEMLEVLGHCIIGSAILFCKSMQQKLVAPRSS